MLTEVIVQEAKAKHGKSAYCSPFTPKMIFHTLYDHINTLYNAIKEQKKRWFGLGMLVIALAPVEKIMIDNKCTKQSYEKGTLWCG